MKDQELEVKFYVSSLTALEDRLRSLGAELAQARVHEVNLRYDTPDSRLTRSYQVLRLRKDTQARVTYKGPGTLQDGARLRRELEFTVGDFDTAHALFEALGYEVSVMYEKYRAVYDLGEAHVTLDEMPYGSFIEIEGPDGATIQEITRRLGLNWDHRIVDSYLVLFDRVKSALQLDIPHLSFESFAGVTVAAEDLGVRLADQA